MKNIIYIPLDERPCNYLYPKYISEVRKDINLITPPLEILGRKKESANINKLWEFLLENIKEADAAIISIEMMCYGGLLPSRLHHFDEKHKETMINNIKKIKSLNNKIKLYASNLIMRTPKYNSSDEEPDYYEEYGESIFKRAYLLDKRNRVTLDKEEEQKLNELEEFIPNRFISDYEGRRKYNIDFNSKILSLVEENLIDFLSIPQDDSAEYGYTAIDQRVISIQRRDKRLQRKVHMYPGADEVGASLLARVINDIEDKKTKIYPFYSSLFGPEIIPLYEDRPMYESLKSHIMVTNSILVDNPEEADLILAINSPGKVMEEAFDQEDKDITYTSFRNLLAFVEKIDLFIKEGKKVIISDSSFSNGGELELINLLDDYEVLDKLVSYKGWNTNCNTLGTTIAQGVLATSGEVEEKNIKKNLIYHILEDGFYQAKVRKKINENILPSLDLNYFDLKDKKDEVSKIIEKELMKMYKEEILKSFKDIEIKNLQVFSPWNRMFEIGINLEII
ncbi:DUF4127 family protein [Clostridium tertium]|uniref:DUF4127 domain-containing protein n=1 Tax=Clostridium tertium TaxID=1559 RepID=A0A6N3GTA3_9CLOT